MRRHEQLSLVKVAGAWAAVGLFFFGQMYLLHPPSNRPYNATAELVWEMALAFIWALSTPLVLWLTDRFYIERQRWLRPFTIHLVAGLLLAIVQCAVHGLIIKAAFNIDSPLTISELLPSFYFNVDKMLMVYWVLVFIGHSYMYYRRYRERELQAAQLEAQLAQAQLQALKMQLHPHFLFNTLNTVSSLMHTDVEAADRMITRLSDLLRLTLEEQGRQTVTLKEEIEMLRRYLEIEQIRFQDRLTVKLNIAAEALEAQVPTLILQPLAENAVKHGIAPCASGGTIEVSARKENGTLLLEVKDNGRGLSGRAEQRIGEGLGLSNTRERLRKLHGSASGFEIRNGATRGVVAAISIPYQLDGIERTVLPSRG